MESSSLKPVESWTSTFLFQQFASCSSQQMMINFRMKPWPSFIKLSAQSFESAHLSNMGLSLETELYA